MFEPLLGYLTEFFRKEYINNKLNHTEFKEQSVISLNHLDNNTDHLYFWQLYSVLGEERIHCLIEKFYKNIFDDKTDLFFSNTFKSFGTVNYHLIGQKQFWLDVMGGGKKYAGGEYRLKRHHDFAKIIMNKRGAARWLMHMENTVYDNTLDLTNDERVKYCILDFIHFFMKKYAVEYNFGSKI